MIIADAVLILGAIITVLSIRPVKGIWLNTTGLSIMASACGMNTVLIPLYIKEISPLSMAGTTGSYFNILIMLGPVVSAYIKTKYVDV